MKYLLSSGRTTERVEEYMLDLFKLYLTIYPGDVPGLPNYGFDFNLVEVLKDDLSREIRSRISNLVNKVNSRFSSGVSLSVTSLELISETKVRVILQAGLTKEEVVVNIY